MSITDSGFAVVVIAGVLNGSFAVPMKWTKRWAWENVWLAWSAVGLLMLPFCLTVATVPGIGALYLRSEPLILGGVIGCGLVWGISQIMFGLGIDRIGIGLGFAIVISLAAVAGSLAPLLLSGTQHSQPLNWSHFLIGISLALVGVGFCSFASTHRGKDRNEQTRNVGMGILLCIAAGVGGAMINVGMVAGGQLAQLAARQGAKLLDTANAIWLPLLFAGFISTALYCAFLLTQNGRWHNFWAPEAGRYWPLALVMAVCWFGSVEIYGLGAAKLGPAGPILGWPIFLCSSIITANCWGAATGEWRETGLRFKQLIFIGIAILVISIFVIAVART
jgi:L-rhamnose-H+ transport protein